MKGFWYLMSVILIAGFIFCYSLWQTMPVVRTARTRAARREELALDENALGRNYYWENNE